MMVNGDLMGFIGDLMGFNGKSSFLMGNLTISTVPFYGCRAKMTIQWLGGSSLERFGYPYSRYIPYSMGSQGAT